MRKNLPLIVGFGLPVVLIVAVILAIYLPRLYIQKPKYNFIFIGQDYSIKYRQPTFDQKAPELYDYSLKDDHMVLVPVQPGSGNGYEKNNLPTVYMYNAQNNTYSAIGPEQLANYKISNTKESPDGYRLSYGGGGDTGMIGFFFGGNSHDYNTAYLVKGGYAQKLNLPANVYISGGDCYGGSLSNCRFVGWVVQ